jgi:hypothetical protein
MKGITRYFLFGFFVLLTFTACSKQPVQEITAAKSAVDSAMAEGAEKYSPAEAGKVNDALTAAMTEVKMQEGKFLKDYKKAKEMLAKVKADADNLKAGLAAKKEEAKKKALAAEESARASVSEAKESLAKAMKSTKAKLDIEVLSDNISGLEESLAEIKKLIDTEDYTTVIEKAGALKAKAEGVAEEAVEATENASRKIEAKKKNRS